MLINPFQLTAKDKYFAGVDAARSLQKRFAREAKIDIVARVRETLQTVMGISVGVAREGGKEYFAGLLRLINSSALLHADYGPYVRLTPFASNIQAIMPCPFPRKHLSVSVQWKKFQMRTKLYRTVHPGRLAASLPS